MNKRKTYDFPNAVIVKIHNRFFESPKWSIGLSVERDRNYMLGALQMLRAHKAGVLK